MADFVKALEDEISELEQQLKADPRYTRLAKLKEVRQLYGAPAGGGVGSAQGAVAIRTTVNPFMNAARKKEHILATAAAIIRGRTDPTPTVDILKQIEVLGLEVHGKDPRNTLSAMLSYAPEFKSHGRSGWTLVPSDGRSENTEAADGDTPSSDDPSTASSRAQPYQPGNPTPNGVNH